LREEYEGGGRAGAFALFLEYFGGSEAQPAYKDAASRHGMSIPQLKSFLHRARQRLRELVREEVLETVPAEADAEEEVAYLQKVLTG
jgi:RNA polymerase sigma-70 factor (ECF subfamily)